MFFFPRLPKGGGRWLPPPNGLTSIAPKCKIKWPSASKLFLLHPLRSFWWKKNGDRVSRQSPRVGGWLPPENILSCHFEKYLHDMDLKLPEHVRSTISLLYKRKHRWNSDIWNFFTKNQFWPIFHWKSTFSGRPCFNTSLWYHTLTDFHDFGINGKRRPYPILW